MRKCRVNLDVLKRRRTEIATHIGEGAFLLASPPEVIRNRDVHYAYRQESSFYYFTGFEEPESLMLFRPGKSPEYVLFVPPKDAEKETWEGFRFGPSGAETEFGADKAYTIDEIDSVLPELLAEVNQIHYQLNLIKSFDQRLMTLLKAVQIKKGRGATAMPDIVDPSEAIGEVRVVKKEDELSLLREACKISGQGHIAAMKFARPGVNEREVEAIIHYIFSMGGAARAGYGSIVATGSNATTLHYTFNDQECQDGDFLLIDAGAEYEYYTGDITRTFPVNGKFTESQRVFYQKVLDVQKKVIAMSKPGLLMSQFQDKAIDMLTEAMLELGLLKGDKAELIENKLYKKYYPHGIGHFLGMDVHDVGAMSVNGEPRKLEPGMVYTIEPGIYVPADDMEAPEEFRGMGVRIEDNILVTELGFENLTELVPKEIDDIEALLEEPLEAQ